MAEVPMAYPRNLGYLIHRLAGYHRNTFRIESTTTQTASAGRVITVNLPENAIIDLKSLRWVIGDAVTSYEASTTPDVYGKLPFAQALIQRMEVYVNGVQVTQGCIEYNTAFRLLRNARVASSKNTSIDFALQNANMDAADPATFPTYGGNTVGDDKQIVVQDWLGLFEAPSTRFLDTGLVGMITLRITLADNNVIVPKRVNTPITQAFPVVAAGAPPDPLTTAAANVSYSLNNFYFTIDSISLSDGMYDMLLRKKLARDGYLSLNFDEYYSFLQDGNTAASTTVRFAVSSQSINKLYGTLRPTDYVSRGKPPVDIDDTAFMVENLQPYYFNTRSFASNDNQFKWNFTINNVMHPQYLASEIEGLAQLVLAENKVGFDSMGNQITSFGEYRNNKFCVGIRLNHPIDGEVRNSYISGFDSRGVNAQLTWQLQNLNGLGALGVTSYCAYVLVNTTNTLRFGVGRSLEVIF